MLSLNYEKRDQFLTGFTLIEIMMVMVIIGLLATMMIVISRTATQSTKIKKTAEDLYNLGVAIEMFYDEHENYPSEIEHGLPSEIDKYLISHGMPKGRWPDSCYDWDNWVDPMTTKPIYQLSLRFCCSAGPAGCNPPIANFDYYSAIYYCLRGACRAHITKPITHPALCVNCGKPI